MNGGRVGRELVVALAVRVAAGRDERCARSLSASASFGQHEVASRSRSPSEHTRRHATGASRRASDEGRDVHHRAARVVASAAEDAATTLRGRTRARARGRAAAARRRARRARAVPRRANPRTTSSTAAARDLGVDVFAVDRGRCSCAGCDAARRTTTSTSSSAATATTYFCDPVHVDRVIECYERDRRRLHHVRRRCRSAPRRRASREPRWGASAS